MNKIQSFLIKLSKSDSGFEKVKMLFSSLTFGVFLSVLCDNLLLTVVVPILPEFLREKASVSVNGKISSWSSFGTQTSLEPNSSTPLEFTLPSSVSSHLQIGGVTQVSSTPSDVRKSDDGSPLNTSYLNRVKSITKSCFKELFHLQMLDEDSKLGLLFSTKAIVQLFCNPLVGRLTIRFGYRLPLCIGNSILFLCSIAFGFADSYLLLIIGRSCHGLASALVVISGMALVAELHPIDTERTLCMGRVMGAAALGVLIGYPFGGFFYAFFGKLLPFLAIATLALFNSVLYGTQLDDLNRHVSSDYTLSLQLQPRDAHSQCPLVPITSCWSLLKDRSILIISIAIWFSTLAMAVLEPTLPVWLIETIDPPKWQLGMVFVPDSVGYFIGTNFFGQFALRIGRWKASLISMASIGLACLMLPFCKTIWQLSLPHFTLGLGLGIVDASLMPLLACFTDKLHKASYGTVYALAQTSVALAYSLGPLLGGQLVRVIGFPDLIRSVGFLNLIFCPFILLLAEHDQSNHGFLHLPIKLKERKQEFYNSISSSTTSSNSSSIDDITNSKISNSKSRSRSSSAGRAKKVRFHFHINSDNFPLTGTRSKGYSVQPERYDRFYDDLDSD